MNTDKNNNKGDKIDANTLNLLKSVIKVLKQNHAFSLLDLVKLYNSVGKKEPIVPLSVFSTKLSPSEALCRYMKENLKLNYHEIAKLIGRDERSIWTSYHRALKKFSDPLPIVSDYPIPISIFKDRSFSILESLTSYLSEEFSLKLSEMARLMNKSSPLVYTVLKRAKDKKASAKK